ncbi:protein FATTY ACID EXPORT 5-like [Mercurialis annua]|uniref:protein FATTY ACID EXPORT 5-like n=1 Tax=Mercurialis annua TaxID=3986 RepID=UPI00215E62A1|nr:protein FATTY ACID EXPORT 5-like [Mercurialis annua]
MHDFCLTIPYGLILVVGGIMGYVKRGSTASLGGGVGTGLLLILAGYIGLKAFQRGKNSYPALLIATVCAAVLTFVMGQRYIQTSKIMPAGVVAGISALMTGFYLYKVATGGNHIPAKAE